MEYRTVFLCAVLAITIFALAFLHINQKRSLVFFSYLILLTAATGLHLAKQVPLSNNVFSKKALYLAKTLQDPDRSDHQTKLVVALEKRLDPVLEQVTGHVLLTINEACEVAPESQISFAASIKPPKTYKNPGVFDYRTFLKRKNIWATGFIDACAEIITVVPATKPQNKRIRSRLTRLLMAPNIQNGGTLSAMLLGTNTIPSDKQNLIRNAGLSHLFAISGTNFSVMSLLVFFVVSSLTRFWPAIYLYCPRQKIAAFFTIGFVLFFLCLVNHEPSITRAGAMIICYLAAIILERQKSVLYSICLAATLLLCLRPQDLFMASFQLSFLCVLILATIYVRFDFWISHHPFLAHWPRPLLMLFKMLLASITLNLLLSPLVLCDFGKVSLAGFVNNLWAVPYFDFIAIPLSLICLVVTTVSAPLAHLVLIPWDLSVSFFFWLLKLFSQANLPALTGWVPHATHTFLFYGGLFLWVFTRKNKVAIVFALLLAGSLAFTLHELRWKNELSITQLDVGQGDAIFIRTPDKNMLIDTGGHRFTDIANMVLVPFLRHQWVTELDVVVITHRDFDHYGGLASLARQIKIKEVWVNSMDRPDQGYREQLNVIQTNGIPIRVVDSSFALNLDSHTRVTVLNPLNQPLPANTDENDQSIVLALTHNEWRALFMGDLSSKGEAHLMANQDNTKLNANLLKLGHHGSKTATSQAFLDVVQPKWALIGVGQTNQFGLPHYSVMQRLKEKNITVLRTDQNGATGVSLTNGKIEPF